VKDLTRSHQNSPLLQDQHTRCFSLQP